MTRQPASVFSLRRRDPMGHRGCLRTASRKRLHGTCTKQLPRKSPSLPRYCHLSRLWLRPPPKQFLTPQNRRPRCNKTSLAKTRPTGARRPEQPPHQDASLPANQTTTTKTTDAPPHPTTNSKHQPTNQSGSQAAKHNEKRTSKNANCPQGKTERQFTKLQMSKLRFQITPMVQTQGLNTDRQMTKLLISKLNLQTKPMV